MFDQQLHFTLHKAADYDSFPIDGQSLPFWGVSHVRSGSVQTRTGGETRTASGTVRVLSKVLSGQTLLSLTVRRFASSSLVPVWQMTARNVITRLPGTRCRAEKSRLPCPRKASDCLSSRLQSSRVHFPSKAAIIKAHDD